jgi:tRNA G18 (ribose-2'-O)-methylase SpoU
MTTEWTAGPEFTGPPIVLIDDLDDPRIAPFRDVKLSNATRDLGQFVLEGEKLLYRLIASRFDIASVLVTDRAAERIIPNVPPCVPVYVVPHDQISDLVGYRFHLGVLSAGRRRAWPPLAEILADAGPGCTLIVCPHVDNPENLGAIVRMADVFGVQAVLAGPKCPDPLSRRVLRVSMGTSLRRPVIVRDDIEAAVDELNASGVELAGAVVHIPGAIPLGQFERPLRLALLLGNEAHGLGPGWTARCDHRLTIPMRPGAESLNVAVAAGILLYHLTGSATAAGTTIPGSSSPESLS